MKKLLFITIVLLFSISLINAQKAESKKNAKEVKEKVSVKLKDGVKHDVYGDGKKFDFPMELVD
jgi:hypothetical protein